MKLHRAVRNNLFMKNKYFSFTTIMREIPTIPPDHPELGNLEEIKKTSYREYLIQKHKELGPIFYFWIKKSKVASLGHPKYWSGVSHLNHRSDHYFMFLRYSLGDKTLLLANGKELPERYKIYVTPTFNQETVYKVHSKVFKRVVGELLPTWIEYAKNGEKVPVQETFSKMVIHIMIDVLYGAKEFPKGYDVKKVYDSMTSPSKVVTKADEVGEIEKLNFVRSFIGDLLRLYRENAHNRTEKTCFLDFVSETKDEELIFSELITMFISGIHTSSTLLILTIYHLARHPEIQRKLQGFIDEHIHTSLIDDISQIRGINYLRACVNETARLTPLVNIATRIDEENDIKFDDGLVIPKGTPVLLPLAQILTDSEFWKDVDTYNPERFRKMGIMYPLQFSPFGFAGGRVCPGKYLAMAEIQYALATVFKNFNVTLINDLPLKFQYFTTNFLKDEIYAKFELRK